MHEIVFYTLAMSVGALQSQEYSNPDLTSQRYARSHTRILSEK